MCLEESFCPFTRDELNFLQPEIYAAPHHPAVSSFALFAFNITLYHSAQLPLMLTGKAKSAQIMRRQEMSIAVSETAPYPLYSALYRLSAIL